MSGSQSTVSASSSSSFRYVYLNSVSSLCGLKTRARQPCCSWNWRTVRINLRTGELFSSRMLRSTVISASLYTANKKPAYDTDDDEIEEENEGCEDSEDNEDDEAAACPEDDDCRDVMKKVFEMLKKADPEYVDSLIRKMEQQEDEHELED